MPSRQRSGDCRNRPVHISAIPGARQHAYRIARAALLAGTPIPFPDGTYWMRRFMNVEVADLPDLEMN
jgi:hypothetical protein